MNNEEHYQEIIKKYIEAEIDSEEAMEMMIQVKGMDSKSYDTNTSHKKSKKWFAGFIKIGSRIFNITTLTAAAVIIGLNILFCMSRGLNGNISDMGLVTKCMKIMMVDEIILIAMAFILSIVHEIRIMHRMGIRVLSIDFFKLDTDNWKNIAQDNGIKK